MFAKTDPGGRARGVSCFLVERDHGLRIGRLERKMGMHGSPTGEVILDYVRVPAANRIGDEGQGFMIAMHTLDRSRPSIAAQAVGIAQGALDYAVGYVKERKAFGRPIAEFQGLQFMLADMAMKIEAARVLTYRACAIIDEGDPDGELNAAGAMAKAFASDVAMEVTTNGVQLLGGLRLHHGLPDGAVHARRQDHPDLRGHQPDPAGRDRQEPFEISLHRPRRRWATPPDQSHGSWERPSRRAALELSVGTPSAGGRRTVAELLDLWQDPRKAGLASGLVVAVRLAQA